jgi:hypothetical protein
MLEKRKMSYEAAFFVVPHRILKLKGLIMSYLLIYETIYQFWNHLKPCFLSNDAIMERTGIKSDSTIREAFRFFEKHGEMERITENGQRYLAQPILKVGVDNQDDTGAKSPPPRRQVAAPPGAKSPHNNKNSNIKKLNKNIRSSNDEHVHEFTFFDTFWDIYKRKQGKQKARQAWKAHDLEQHASSILEDVKFRFEHEWKNTQLNYLPMPSTYLNGRRWEDERIEAATKQKEDIVTQSQRLAGGLQ